MRKQISILTSAFLFILLIYSCKEEVAPTVSTDTVTNITALAATCGGNVTDEGSGTVVSRGVCWSTNAAPTTGNSKTVESGGSGPFTSTLTGLDAATTYYVRAYAINPAGTAYGSSQSFKTLGEKPYASVAEATGITANSAILNGTATGNYLTTTVTFEYGLTTSYGKSATATQSPVTGNSPVQLSAVITELNAGATYHFKVKAVNSLGTVSSEDMVFETPFMDRDGNQYHTVTIGTQVWMQENLRTTRFNDGTIIKNYPIPAEWAMITVPSYVWYDNNQDNKDAYGALYNFYTIKTGKLCPAGWHVPSREEWTAMTGFLGGVTVAGGKMKETGTLHWNAPNTDATNESKFTALPGGYRSSSNGSFFSIRDNASWWTSSLNTPSTAYMTAITLYNTTDVQIVSGNLRYGASVRCLKDN